MTSFYGAIEKKVFYRHSAMPNPHVSFFIFFAEIWTPDPPVTLQNLGHCAEAKMMTMFCRHTTAPVEEKECDWKKSFWRESANGWMDGWISFFIKMDDVQNCFEMMKPNCRPQWGSKCLELWLVFASWLFWKANNQNLLTFCLLVRKQCDIKLHK